MKPRNFPWRRARRVARSKQRAGAELNATDLKALYWPTDIRIRIGSKHRRET